MPVEAAMTTETDKMRELAEQAMMLARVGTGSKLVSETLDKCSQALIESAEREESLTAQLSLADENSVKLEALLDPKVKWSDTSEVEHLEAEVTRLRAALVNIKAAAPGEHWTTVHAIAFNALAEGRNEATQEPKQ